MTGVESDPLGLGDMIAGAAAVGVAAMGIIEGLKFRFLRLAGFRRLSAALGGGAGSGDGLLAHFDRIYGANSMEYLRQLYAADRRGGGLRSTLRQGVRLLLMQRPADAAQDDRVFAVIHDVVPSIPLDRLKAVAEALRDPANDDADEPLDPEQRRLLNLFEIALDARLDAALAAANRDYVHRMRLAAIVVALLLAVGAALYLDADRVGVGVVVGLAAVPLAPISKSVVDGLYAASKALGRRS